MTDKAWVQFLLVAVPVMSLIGAWLALRGLGGRRDRTSGSRADRNRGDEGRTKNQVGDR
ncbi:MAG: hypothetical protein J0M28_12630 [Thauera sp.]|nr:hypothetical protein [Thauera sp.]